MNSTKPGMCVSCGSKPARPDRKTCQRCVDRNRRWAVANQDRVKRAQSKPAYLAKKRAMAVAKHRADPRKRILSCARERAKARGCGFDLSLHDIRIPPVCPVLGIPIAVGRGLFTKGSPTLDRIEPGLGYVRSNVWVTSYRANRIKNDATLGELESLIVALKRRSFMFKSHAWLTRAK